MEEELNARQLVEQYANKVRSFFYPWEIRDWAYKEKNIQLSANTFSRMCRQLRADNFLRSKNVDGATVFYKNTIMNILRYALTK